MSYWSSLFQELGARRTRLRKALGDRGQSLFEFALLSAFVMGSLGLYLRAWMPSAAPWGFALPFVFIAGYLALDVRRQRDGAENAERKHDLIALGWTLLCAALAIGTLFYAWQAEPPPPPEAPVWQPPEDVQIFDLSP